MALAEAGGPPGDPRAGRAGLPAVAAALLLAGLPLGFLAVEAVAGGLGLGLLGDGRVLQAGLNTLVTAIASTAIALALGGGAALLAGLTDLPGRRAFAALALLPMLIPSQIAALAWGRAFDPAGPLARASGLGGFGPNPLESAWGVWLVMGVEHMPIAFLAVIGAVTRIPAEPAEAARVAGAGPSAALAVAARPLVAPALAAATALSLVSAAGNFGVPALLGIPGDYPVLATLIYQRLSGFGPAALGEAAALAGLLGLGTLGLLRLQSLMAGRAARVADGGRLVPRLPLGARRRQLAIPAWMLMIALSLLPLTALIAASLVPAPGVPLTPATASLDGYRAALDLRHGAGGALLTSAWLALVTALIAMAVALPLGLLAARGAPGARLAAGGFDLALALPGTVFAIGVILAFLPPLPGIGLTLYGTPAILLAAYLGRFPGLVLAPVRAAAERLDPAPEQAARLAGAGFLARIRVGAWPALAGPAAGGGLLVLLTAFNELTLSALLWSRGAETVGVAIYARQAEGDSAGAAALSVIALAAALGLAGLAFRMIARLPGLESAFGDRP
ncbi:ABC transporter permease subunit [Tistrella mobilis]|jgi:iron(III) transport system permease protein|uniref:ABC transporter permease n=1 Tax=Tistrella mobilis TaxID=171437 RepID=UPI003556145C